ncbi:hypothetical protein Pcinc_030426 [Petrolisthes cinctipes]|uniref:Uncharacterized protein n=1 Tax=Petrolisthes cinctipes TaxID=88211 RepID=A0AAE1EYU2_PETCI|nr:hypothetical protein Pcinc_030426 [Petrolisthes cinctipes]
MKLAEGGAGSCPSSGSVSVVGRVGGATGGGEADATTLLRQFEVLSNKVDLMQAVVAEQDHSWTSPRMRSLDSQERLNSVWAGD